MSSTIYNTNKYIYVAWQNIKIPREQKIPGDFLYEVNHGNQRI